MVMVIGALTWILSPPSSPAADPPRNEEAAASPRLLPAAAGSIVKSTNDFRQQHDEAPLEVDDQLQQAAETFAKYMAAESKYGHGADGRTPAERAEAAGYQYCMVRENIAYRRQPGEADPEDLATNFTQGWIDSPEHRENLVADYVTETGVAIATTDGHTFYAVQLFGRPQSASIRIRLSNETDTAHLLRVENDYGADEFELPPRMRLTMTRCLSTKLSLANAEAKIQVSQSSQLELRIAENGKPTFVTSPLGRD